MRVGLKGNHCNHYQRWSGRCRHRQMGKPGDESGAKHQWSGEAGHQLPSDLWAAACPHLSLELLTSRSPRQWMSVVEATQSAVLCHIGHRKQIL